MLTTIRALRFLFLLSFCFFVISCKNDDIAPGDTTLTISAEPQSVEKSGTSIVKVSGIADGRPLVEGTQIRFFIDAGSGRLDPTTSRIDQTGFATSTFQASSQEGEVTVSAMSGPAVISTKIQVEGEPKDEITLSAQPGSLPEQGGQAVITAFVQDPDNNPVSAARLSFTTDAGDLQSNGQFVTTNDQGIATDTLTTSTTTTVTVTVVNATADAETIVIPVGSVQITCDFTFTPTDPTTATPIQFTDTSIDPQQRIRTSFWDFGDTITAQGKTAQHTYSEAKVFTVAHSVIDVNGQTFTCIPRNITVQ